MQTNDFMDNSDIRAEETQEPSEKSFEEDGVSGDAGCEPPVCRPAGAAEAAGPLKKKHVLRSVLLGIGGVIVLLAVASVLFINSKLNKLNRSGSAIPFFGYLAALCIGGETAALICTFLYKKLLTVIIYAATSLILLGLLSMYLTGDHALTAAKK